MPFKTIFEIGPIGHFTTNARKTMDVWGGSFLFSWLAGRLVKFMQEYNGCQIERPILAGNSLWDYIQSEEKNSDPVKAGTIPDQIYCIHQDENLPKEAHTHYSSLIEEMYNKCNGTLKSRSNQFITYIFEKNADDLVKDQLTSYFRLFFVTDKNESDWPKLERAIASRGRVYVFENANDAKNSTDNKRDKCSLCGDYKKVVTAKNPNRNDIEQLCAICTIKRGLIEQFNPVSFRSTTDIGACVVKEVLRNNCKGITQDIYDFVDNFFMEKCIDEEMNTAQYLKLKENKNINETISHLPYEIYFSDNPISINFRKAIKEKCNIKDHDKVWIDSGYYSVVSIDGDNTGDLFKNVHDQAIKKEISSAIAQYAHEAEKTLEKYGQLIYSGGEDTLFICHPRHVLQAVFEFSVAFKTAIAPFKKDATISAGAYICPHKHPLKLALRGASHLLEAEAKKVPGKNCLSLKLIRGAGEVNTNMFSIQPKDNAYTIDDFSKLIASYQNKEISRTFVYKLRTEMDVYSELGLEKDKVKAYVREVFLKTHSASSVFDDTMATLIDRSVTAETDKTALTLLVNRLYLARFLTGGE